MTQHASSDWRGVMPLMQVSNLQHSIDYYCEILGFRREFSWPSEGPPKWAAVSHGDVWFMLTVDLGTSSSPFIAEKGNGVVFYIITRQIESLYHDLEEREAMIVQDLMSFGGRRQFSIADPSGYVITFSEPFQGQR